MYFSKITHSYNFKNKLQQATLTFIRSMEYQLVDSPDELKTFVEDRIGRLNRSHPRCGALSVKLHDGHSADYKQLYVSDLITLTLYAIKGTFTQDSQTQSSRATGPVQYDASGPQLGLFTNL